MHCYVFRETRRPSPGVYSAVYCEIVKYKNVRYSGVCYNEQMLQRKNSTTNATTKNECYNE